MQYICRAIRGDLLGYNSNASQVLLLPNVIGRGGGGGERGEGGARGDGGERGMVMCEGGSW